MERRNERDEARGRREERPEQRQTQIQRGSDGFRPDHSLFIPSHSFLLADLTVHHHHRSISSQSPSHAQRSTRRTHHYPAFASRDRTEAWRRRGTVRAGWRVKAESLSRRGIGIPIGWGRRAWAWKAVVPASDRAIRRCVCIYRYIGCVACVVLGERALWWSLSGEVVGV
jgi:hypothetical protein